MRRCARCCTRPASAGARALLLRDMSLDGAAMQAFTRRARPRTASRPACSAIPGSRLPRRHARRRRIAARRARRQEAEGAAPPAQPAGRARRVTFEVARTPAEVARAHRRHSCRLKPAAGKAGAAPRCCQNAGDAAFIRRATAALAASGQCEIVTLRAGATAVAAAIVPRHLDRAYYFKIGIDERFAKVVARRAADTRPHPASVRRSGDQQRRLHRQRRAIR